MRNGVEAWIAAPELSAVWERIRRRLEQSGGAATGRLSVELHSRAERHALGGLLGCTVVDRRRRIDLVDLEQRLVSRTSYASLAEVAEAVTGVPLRNRPQERAVQLARRQAPAELARSLVDAPWVEPWLSSLVRSGLLARSLDGEALVAAAVRVVDAVLEEPAVPRSRVELSARLLGDAHALDEDQVLHAAVLRALAAAAGEPLPEGVLARRALWQRYGVSPDLVSSTCLTLGLRSSDGSGASRRLELAARDGAPVHLSGWDLRRDPALDFGATAVLVCENPRVLEALAQRFKGAVAAVCTSGQPNTVVSTVLRRLQDAGCGLRYHGDFDWPGVAISNRLVAEVGVQPWRMGVGEYEEGLTPNGLLLAGPPVEPAWDDELGAVMRSHGRAVHEEAVLESLLDEVDRHW